VLSALRVALTATEGVHDLARDGKVDLAISHYRLLGPGRAPQSNEHPAARVNPLLELALLFARLGFTAFGGPAAHIAMMEEEVVRRRRWLTSDEFLDLLGATNLIPGPNSTEMAIHIGHRRAGWLGLVVAGTCFIVPAAAITLAFAWAYVRFGTLPRAGAVLYGIKPVMIAVVLQALWSLGRSAVKTRTLGLLGVISGAAAAVGVNELLVFLASGLLAMFVLRPPSVTLAIPPVSIFLVFAKIGSVLFGSGYVLLAFLRTDLVEHRHWLTEAQLLDAIAVGQVTPGPVFTTATFIGYVLRGFPGAGAATVGIFLPAFVFVALSGLLIPKLRASKRAGAFLDGVNVASLALMAVVTAQLGRAALVDWMSVLIAAASALVLVRWKLNSFWLILAGAAAGALR
jgi:chromate transporter